MILDLILFWLVMGTVWGAYSIIDYYYSNPKDKLPLFWEVLSIFANVVLFPIQIIVGFFVYIVVLKEDNAVKFNFSVVRLSK